MAEKSFENEKKRIRKSLIEQLERQNRKSAYTVALVDDYMSNIEIKKSLLDDIQKRGVRYSTTTGNGYTVEKANESVQNLSKVQSTMLTILSKLNLYELAVEEESDDDYL